MRRSRISSGKQAKLTEHFVAGTTARTAARLVRVNKTSAAYYYHRLRELIYRAVADAAPFAGEIEVDESYFGGHRKGKRGRGAAGKIPVFGLLKRGGKVYAVVIANAKATTLLPILKQRIVPDSIVYSDSLPSYNALDVPALGICGSITPSSLQRAKTTSTASKISGTRPNVICVNLTVCPKPISPYS
jgi:transposase